MKEMEQELKLRPRKKTQRTISRKNRPLPLIYRRRRKNLMLSLRGELSVNTGNGAGSRRSSLKTPHRSQPHRRKRPRVMLTKKN